MGIKNTVCKCCAPSSYCGCSGIPTTLHASLGPLVTAYGAPATCVLTYVNSFTGYNSVCLHCTGGTINPNTKSLQINFACIGPQAFILTVLHLDNNFTTCTTSTNFFASVSATASPCGSTFAWTGAVATGTGLTGSFGVTS